MVEHDPEVMHAADHIVDLGPGAGEHGGKIIFEGDSAADGAIQRLADREYLRGELHVARRKHRRDVDPTKALVSRRAPAQPQRHRVAIPLGLLTVVTGVSGSGKSTWSMT